MPVLVRSDQANLCYHGTSARGVTARSLREALGNEEPIDRCLNEAGAQIEVAGSVGLEANFEAACSFACDPIESVRQQQDGRGRARWYRSSTRIGSSSPTSVVGSNRGRPRIRQRCHRHPRPPSRVSDRRERALSQPWIRPTLRCERPSDADAPGGHRDRRSRTHRCVEQRGDGRRSSMLCPTTRRSARIHSRWQGPPAPHRPRVRAPGVPRLAVHWWPPMSKPQPLLH